MENYHRGEYPRGHNVRCKHCGHVSAEHEMVGKIDDAKKPRKGFKVSLRTCVNRGGYEPDDLPKWEAEEKRHQAEEEQQGLKPDFFRY